MDIYRCNLREALGSSEALAYPWESDTCRHYLVQPNVSLSTYCQGPQWV